jgi:hypothetical protein
MPVTDGAKACPGGKTKDKSKMKTLPYSPENKTIPSQLSKSACSAGANY